MRRFVTPRAAVAVAICLVGAGLAGSASAQELGLIYAVVMRRVGFTTDRAELLDEAADASASSTVCGRSGIGDAGVDAAMNECARKLLPDHAE